MLALASWEGPHLLPRTLDPRVHSLPSPISSASGQGLGWALRTQGGLGLSQDEAKEQVQWEQAENCREGGEVSNPPGALPQHRADLAGFRTLSPACYGQGAHALTRPVLVLVWDES